MNLRETLTTISTEDAAAVAALLNADQLARAALGMPTTFTAADVQRVGRIVAEYAPPKSGETEAPKPTVPFTIPSRPAPQAAAAGLAAVEQEVLR